MAEETGNARTNRREERAKAAERHIAEVDARYKADVARSLEEIKLFDEMPALPATGVVPEVRVVDQDSVAAVLEQGRGVASACDVAVLDFASFTNPGGGYERGAWAQEEALCAESTLFNVLREQKDWYTENRRRNINCELYRHRGLVVPKVRFERDGYHSYADVIVVAAPNLRRARENYNVKDDAALAAMRNRIRLVLGIADELGHDKLILGAFGCGVFGWDASAVAEIFLKKLASGRHLLKQVTFAIPSSRFEENLERFQHAFANFPSENPEPYVERAARPVPAVEVVEEEDEEEDDWRQYL